MTKKMKAPITLEQRITRLEERNKILSDRVRQTERVLRIIGYKFELEHMTESQANEWAARIHSLNNAMRDLRRNIGLYGNEFDRAPHFIDPWREHGIDVGDPRKNGGVNEDAEEE